MKNPKEFIFLVDAFKSLPNIGTKGANKIANFFLAQDTKYQNDFINRLKEASEKLKSCEYCNATSIQPKCEICASQRNPSLCIVANLEDQQRIEDSRMYRGYYHILMINPSKNLDLTSFNLEVIKKQIEALGIQEVIIATPFSIYGEVISEFLKNKLSEAYTQLPIFRLGFGIPLNASIDFIDDETIKQSFHNKKKIS